MRPLAAFALIAALLLGSCSRRDAGGERSAGSTSSAASAGDVRIETSGGELELALVGDTISAGLTPGALAKVRHETDTATVGGSGLGPSIERLVKNTVQSAVSSRVTFPVSAVKDVRYHDGAIEFEWNERPTRLLEQTKVNGKPFLESFRPEDAERFVQVVRAKIEIAQ